MLTILSISVCNVNDLLNIKNDSINNRSCFVRIEQKKESFIALFFKAYQFTLVSQIWVSLISCSVFSMSSVRIVTCPIFRL